ncbi:MAG TPA: ATP-binding cassette domain-containing protein [Acidobacteriota bacterium]|nr:ATP-binding cassette domain-containing protein [Acidobacteriota bacterium]
MASKLDLEIQVSLNEVTVRRSEDVVGPLTVQIARGEFLSLVGPGTGKGLVLRAIAGLEPLESGSIDFHDSGQPAARGLGFVFRDSALFPWRSVLGNVTLEAEIRRLDSRTCEQWALRLLAAMSLAGSENRRPCELLPEEAQRAAICRALLNKPSLLLLDDPFGSMDFAAREHLVSDFQRLWMDFHFAVVLTTGDISEAVLLSDRIMLMSQRPERIIQILEIDLPRPRRFDKATTPLMAEYASRVRTIFRSQGLPY